MRKLIIDLNSIVTSSLLVGKDPDAFTVDGKKINTCEYGYNNFLNTYRKTLDELSIVPIHTIGVFDAPRARERRQKKLDQYKKHRADRPKEYYKEFNELMNKVKRFIRHLGGSIVSAKRYEADDVIAAIAPKLDCVIWSKDKDLLSIGEPMFLDGDLYIGDTCGDRFAGIPRRFIRLYRTLVGDPGDFGPGTSAKGFGEKAFLDMWIKYGDEGLDTMCELIEERRLEELEEDVPDFKPLQKIIDSARMVYKTWRVAGWLPVPDHALDWQVGMVRGKDCDTFDLDFAEYYQHNTLVTADNLDKLVPLIMLHTGESDYVSFDLETDVPPESGEWLAEIKKNLSRPPITVDVLMSRIVGGSITVGDNMQHTYYFCVEHADTNNISMDQFKDIIMSLNKPIVVYNAGGFEIPVIKLNWDEWLPDVYCCQIAQNYVNENEWAGLKNAARNYLHYKQQSYQEVTQGRGMSELSGQEVFSYGCDDTIVTAALFNHFETVMDIEGTFDIYCMVEQYPMYMVASSFVNGINCDLSVLEELEKKDRAEYEKSMQIIHEYLTEAGWEGASFEPLEDLSPASVKKAYLLRHGNKLTSRFRKIDKLAALMDDDELSELILKGDLGEINQYLSDNFTPCINFKPNSWKQKAKLLYEVMGLPIRYRNELTDSQKKLGITEGSPGTDEDCIKWAMKDADEKEKKVLEAMLRCTAYKTRSGLYYHPYKYLVHWTDGKLHPSLKQSSTTSRRFAPSGPNVNQLPKRSEEGRKVRGCIVPHHKDAVIVSPDFSGQELRMGAHVTQDENFLSCYIGDNKKDLHTITAFEICQKQGKEFSSYDELASAIKDKENPKHKLAKNYRAAKAKGTNFLSQYTSLGGGAWTLSRKLQVPEDVAQQFLDAKSAAFPGVDMWKAEYSEWVQKHGYAETLLGVRKHVAELLKKMDVNYVLRSSLNFRIQSSSAEQTKLVLAKIWEVGLLDLYDVRFYFPVHDEICFSVAKKDLVAFAAELKPIMTQDYADMTVPIESSFSVGYNFANLDEIPWDGCQEWLDKQEEREDG